MIKKSCWFFLGGIIVLVLSSCSTPASGKKSLSQSHTLPPILSKTEPSPTNTKSKEPLPTQNTVVPDKEKLIAQERDNLTNQPKKITNVWEGTDIRNVLQDIAVQANVPIIVDETIPPTAVTLDVKEGVSLEEALRMVLLTKGYFKKIKDQYGTYYLVGSGTPDSLMSLEISQNKKFVTNRPAEEIYPLLSPSLAPFVMKSGKNDYFIVATAPPYVLDKIAQEIGCIDQSRPQIVIEIMVCESRRNDSQSIGIDWPQVLKIQGTARATWQKEQHGNGWTYTGKLGTNLEGAIQALAQDGKLAIKAQPNIAVLDGEEAVIDVSTDFYVNLYESLPQMPAFSEIGSPYYSSSSRCKVEPIKVGTVLKVKPRVSREGPVLLSLQSDVSSLLAVKDDGYPVVSRTSVKTTIKVRSGETVTLGGLYQESIQESFSGLPGLKKSRLFGTKKSSKESTELTVFLTPKILGKI